MAKKKTTKPLKQLNETGKRTGERRKNAKPVVANSERRKTKRRRQIDPTTCEREYDNAEIEFMHALDEYKRASGRMFPTCSEILEVIVGLGYRKVAEACEGFAFENESDSTESDEACDADISESELEDQMA